MLGKVFRLPGSSFKRIPNPTPDPWLKELDACVIQFEFQGNVLRMIQDPAITNSTQLLWIQESWTNTLLPSWKNRESEVDIDMRDAVQNVLQQCDTYLKSCGEPNVIWMVNAHVSIVLEEINDPASALHSRECDTEEEIWQHYFDVIRGKVNNFQPMPDAYRVVEGAKKRTPETSVEPAVRQDIWLTLMFRMSLWWLLHDFDENDQLIIPTRLKGSRMPVYIL